MFWIWGIFLLDKKNISKNRKLQWQERQKTFKYTWHCLICSGLFYYNILQRRFLLFYTGKAVFADAKIFSNYI